MIICGDSLIELRKLESDSIDMGITSPPYNKNEKNKGWLVDSVVYDGYKDSIKEDVYQQNQIDVLNELFRVIKPGGSFFYNHKTRWEKGKMIHPMEWLSKTNWCIRQEIIWDRNIAANIRGWRFWQVDERIYWLYKPINGNLIGEELESKDALMTSIWHIRPENKNTKHPAPFPIELPLRAILSTVKTMEATIIDPYCGSGTTLVAADYLGYNYIGIDISQTYIEFAENRLKDYSQEIPKMLEEINRHKVEKTFKQRKQEGLYKKRQSKKANTN